MASFGIEVTIVEPGMARTRFGRNAERGTPFEAYERTSVGELRRAMSAGQVAVPGDPAKIARAIIASADAAPAPLRLALGSDTYQAVRGALVRRLEQLDAQRELALSTDGVP